MSGLTICLDSFPPGYLRGITTFGVHVLYRNFARQFEALLLSLPLPTGSKPLPTGSKPPKMNRTPNEVIPNEVKQCTRSR